MSLTGILASSPAFAADDGGSGLPQLDFSTWPTQIFWLVVSFGLAYLLMRRLVTPRIASVLEERHTRLESDMQMARQATDEAESLRTTHEKTLADARSEASSKTRDSLAAAQAEAETKNNAAITRIAGRIEKAEARIAEARTAAMKEIDDVAIGVAIDTAAALAGVTITKADAQKAVAAAAKAGEQN